MRVTEMGASESCPVTGQKLAKPGADLGYCLLITLSVEVTHLASRFEPPRRYLPVVKQEVMLFLPVGSYATLQELPAHQHTAAANAEKT